MYNFMDKENYGTLEKIELLEGKTYKVIGELFILIKVYNARPDLLYYDKQASTAITNKHKELQGYINRLYGYEKYELIFTDFIS